MAQGKRWQQFAMIVGVSATAMAAGGQLAANVAGSSDDFYAPLETFSQVLFRVQHNYVEERPASELIEGAIEGMLSTLDPFSLYLNPDEYKAFQEDTGGQYYGIGVQINEEADRLVVVVAFPGQPAARAGLRTGDHIMAVDGQPISEIGADEAITLIRGRKGTTVQLTVQSAEAPEVDKLLDVMRDEIHTPSVQSVMIEPAVGYVRLNQFQDGSATDIREAVKLLESEAKTPIQGLLLDLRGNPGGLLVEAVKLTDLFVSDGTIVSTKGRTNNDIEKARQPGTLSPYELVVLVDGGSASASEIVAGALQDLNRATIVGERSYGKGSVQNIYPMPDQSALRLTISKYYTPSGRPINRLNPVVPDVEVDLVISEDGVVALDWLEGQALNDALTDDSQIIGALEVLHAQVASLPKN